MSTPQPPPGQGPGSLDFTRELEELRSRLRNRPSDDPDQVGPAPELVADLETAYEELRVADEEVRAQQDQISRLIQSHHLLHWQHERTLAMLPLPAVLTDAQGLIRSVNAPSAALVVARVARLLGKPIFTLFEPSERRELRQLLAVGRARVQRRLATVVPQDGDPVQVDLWVMLRPGENSEATWLLLPAGGLTSPTSSAVLPEALTELAGLAVESRDLHDVLGRAAEICSRSMGVTHVSINVGPPDHPEALYSTSRLAQALDGAQVTAGQGPCPSAFASSAVVTSPDVAADARWPRLARFLPSEPVSVVSMPVEVGRRQVGVLNVYGEGGPLEAWVEEAAELLAATLGAVFHELELNAELERLGEDMQRALGSRAVIEQAKGIMMARFGCGPDEAFAQLTRLSSQRERKLRDIAREIVEQAAGEV
jgi:PAS domain-containing protein